MRKMLAFLGRIINQARQLDWLFGGLWAAKGIPIITGIGFVIWTALIHVTIPFVTLAGLAAFGLTLLAINESRRSESFRWLPTSLRPTPASLVTHLYVGFVGVGLGQLSTDQCLEITITGFNGLSRPLVVSSVTGMFGLKLREEDSIWDPLPPPRLKDVFGHTVLPTREFIIVLEQRIPGKCIDAFVSALKTNHGVSLSMTSLAITLSDARMPDIRANLHLWDAIRLRQQLEYIVARREIFTSINSIVGNMG